MNLLMTFFCLGLSNISYGFSGKRSVGGAIFGIPIIIFSMIVVWLGVIAFFLCSLGA